MRLEEILLNRTPGKVMKAGNWKSYCWLDDDGHMIINVHHHYTMMLQYRVASKKIPAAPVPERFVAHVDLGYESKSDQDGMNRIFRALGLSWYFSRKGGSAHIVDLLRTPQSPLLPKYMRDPTIRREVYGYAS